MRSDLGCSSTECLKRWRYNGAIITGDFRPLFFSRSGPSLCSWAQGQSTCASRSYVSFDSVSRKWDKRGQKGTLVRRDDKARRTHLEKPTGAGGGSRKLFFIVLLRVRVKSPGAISPSRHIIALLCIQMGKKASPVTICIRARRNDIRVDMRSRLPDVSILFPPTRNMFAFDARTLEYPPSNDIVRLEGRTCDST